jgi:cytochrome c oxidase cbb3-type subunit 4
MDNGIVSGIVTLVFIAVYVAIVWWACSRHNKQMFEEASRLPFEEDATR